MNWNNIQPYSFGGATQILNNGTAYATKAILSNSILSESSPIEIERANNYPVYSGQKLAGREYLLQIEIKSSGSLETLQGYFDTSQEMVEYRVKDISNNSYWYVNAKPLALTQISQNAVLAKMYTDDPIWRKVAGSTVAWNVTSSGGTVHVNNTGSYYALPIITLDPQAARAGGYGYRRWVAIYNRTSKPVVGYPVNVLGTTLNHATLVSGGKAQADGDDFRVWVNSRRNVYRWPGGGGWNSTTLTCWVNLNFSGGISMLIADDIAASGALTNGILQVTSSYANGILLNSLASAPNKCFILGTEAFTYTGTNPVLMQITGVQRAQKDTAEAAHSVGDRLYWIENDVWVVYGNASVSAPDMTEATAYEPMIDLTTSTNSSFAWTNFRDFTYPTRPLSWTFGVTSVGNAYGGTTGAYKANHGAGGTIASEMGMRMSSYYWNNLPRGENGGVRWSINLPLAGGTIVSSAGEKYKSAATTYPSYAALQYLNDAPVQQETVWNEGGASGPGTAGTWGSFTRASASLGDTASNISFVLMGGMANVVNVVMFEVDNVTIGLNTSQTPVVSLGAENSAYDADLTLENETTGQILYLNYPSAVGKSIEIDCDNQTILDEDNTRLAAALTKNSRRVQWMRLDPGVNVLKYTEEGVSDVDVTIEYEPRSL